MGKTPNPCFGKLSFVAAIGCASLHLRDPICIYCLVSGHASPICDHAQNVEHIASFWVLMSMFMLGRARFELSTDAKRLLLERSWWRLSDLWHHDFACLCITLEATKGLRFIVDLIESREGTFPVACNEEQESQS